MEGSMRLARLMAALCALSCAMARPEPAAASETRFRGLLDLVAAERVPAYDLNTLIRGDSPLDAYSLRLFANTQVHPRLQVFTQVILRDDTGPYVDGAYLMFTPRPDLDLHVLAGKIPWAIGTWAPHTYSNKNPLVTPPLMYHYGTTIAWYRVPPDADGLLASAGTNTYGSRGMALVDDSYWDVGVTVTGSQRPWEYAAGVTAGTPGWGSTSRDENAGKTVLGRIGVTPWTWFRAGVSGAYGPYLIRELNPSLPTGKTVSDYNQKLLMADLQLTGGHAELRAEAATGAWQSPFAGDLDYTSGYVELKYAFSFGGYVAGRWDELTFGDVTGASGATGTWDSDVHRYEVGVGYRLNRDVVAKGVYQHNRIEKSLSVPHLRDQAILAAQLSVAF
jgi:hypothetical protein